MSYLDKRRSAFGFALRGFVASVRREPHIRIHLLAAALAIAAGILLRINGLEWTMIAGCICLVIICELFNTAIEKLCDVVTGEYHPVIGYIKDVSAAAVLLACLLSVIAGLIIFGPKLISLIL